MATETARMLRLTSPLLHGQDVQAVQSRLVALGYSPGAVDGYYGDATAAAVRAFQRDHGLEADGIVGPKTSATLSAAKPSGGNGNGGGGSVGRRALAEAL